MGGGGGGVVVEQNATFSSITDPDMWVFKEFDFFLAEFKRGFLPFYWARYEPLDHLPSRTRV